MAVECDLDTPRTNIVGANMKKPKHRKEVEKMIHSGYRNGVCDMDGNSVETVGGRYVSKPRSRGVVKLHKVYKREDY